MSGWAGLRVQHLRGQQSWVWLPTCSGARAGPGHSEAPLPHQAPGWDSDVFHLLSGRRVMPAHRSVLLLVSQAHPKLQHLCLFSLGGGASLQTSASRLCRAWQRGPRSDPRQSSDPRCPVHSPGARAWVGGGSSESRMQCGAGCMCGSNSRSLLKAMLVGVYFPS